MKLINLLRKYAGKPIEPEVDEDHTGNLSIASTSTVHDAVVELHEYLPANVYDWPEYWREAYEERAAILEFDADLSREEAEKESEKFQRETHAKQK